MIGQIIDAFCSAWESLCPFYIVSGWEHALVVKNGRYNRTLNPGIRFRIPFIEEIMTCSSVYTTGSLTTQTLTTADGKVVVLDASCRYRIRNPKKFLLEAEDAEEAVFDFIQIAIAELVKDRNYEEIYTTVFWDEVTALASSNCTQWGVSVTKVFYTTFGKIRTLRLIMDSPLQSTE